MKVYMINDEEINELLSKLELTKLRGIELLDSHDPKRIEWQEMHRSFHYYVCDWINGVKK